MFVFHIKYYCRSRLIKCDRANFGVFNIFFNSIEFLFVKNRKVIKFLGVPSAILSFCWTVEAAFIS